MKKIFILNGLNCPHCSAKIEKDVGEVHSVTSSVINLMQQTLTIELSDSYSGDILKTVTDIVKNYEPDVSVELKNDTISIIAPKKDEKKKLDKSDKIKILRFALGAVIYLIGLSFIYILKNQFIGLGFLIVSYIILGFDVVLKALKNIIKGQIFDENFLMSISTVGAFIIGEYPEAVAVMLFYQIGEFFQDYAVEHSRKSIADLMDIRPDTAFVMRNGKMMTVSPSDVKIGETIIIKAGEKIPLDGTVIDGSSMLDTKALTGESIPKAVSIGQNVLSGCVNLNGILTVKVTKEYEKSTVSKILELVETASDKKAPTENFITTFSKYYTPVVVILAAALAVIPPLLGGNWAEWIHRGLVFLVISCPCALVISIPLTFFGGIGASSKKGILVKGSNYLEALSRVETVVFDKTGTLTKGVFEVTDVTPEEGFSVDDVIKFAAYAECMSNHPIAKSVMRAYGKTVNEKYLSDYEEISGKGINAKYKGSVISVGNEKLMEQKGIDYIKSNKVGTKVYVGVNGKFAGCITISDKVKRDSKNAIADLRHLGISRTVMLTGDNEETAKDVSKKLGIDEYFAGLLPEGKVKKLEELEKNKGSKGILAFVGDGINDAPVLAMADVGIAMGGLGSDAAIEAADVVLMTDEPSKLAEAFKTARATKSIVMQNIIFAIGVKVLFLILGAFGIAGMWEAVFGDVGVMIIAVLNAMRILKK